MWQAEALALLVEAVRRERDLSIICYSGYTLEELRRLETRRPAIGQVLATVDVLIDGRYEHAWNDSQGLRGSSNQRIHFLSSRHRGLKRHFETAERRQEIHAQPDGELAVGLPTLERWRRVSLDPSGQTRYQHDERP
jgi:anaerobic ribonucleoside-triphosphate reductase activating protein